MRDCNCDCDGDYDQFLITVVGDSCGVNVMNFEISAVSSLVAYRAPGVKRTTQLRAVIS